MKNLTTNTLATVILIAVLCILVEGMLFGNGMIFFALLGAFFVYISMKQQKKAIFWLGMIFLLIALLSMWSLRLFLVIVVVYLLWKMIKGEPIQISLLPKEDKISSDFNKKKNKIFQFDETLSESYIWKDVHLQNLVGEITVDTTDTILPKGTSFIAIRQGFGKITIIVPYEIPVRVHFNTLVGQASVFKENQMSLWNESISIKDGYTDDIVAERELVITASSFFGDLEVIRK